MFKLYFFEKWLLPFARKRYMWFISNHGETEGGIPRLLNDFQEMVKKYLVEQVGIPSVEKVEIKVTKIF